MEGLGPAGFERFPIPTMTKQIKLYFHKPFMDH